MSDTLETIPVPGGVLLFVTADHMLYEATRDGMTFTVRLSDNCHRAKLTIREEGVGAVLTCDQLEGLVVPLLRMADTYARWKGGAS